MFRVLEIDNFGRYLIKMAFKKSKTPHEKPSEMESFITESIYLAKSIFNDDTNRMANFLVNKMSQNYGDGWNAFVQTKRETSLGYCVKSSTFLKYEFDDFIFAVYKTPCIEIRKRRSYSCTRAAGPSLG